jgi:transcriptional regulator with XRE-family HTH domain
MLRTNLARAVCHLRQARGWRQIDLGARAGVSRQLVSQLECGELAGLTVRSIARVTEALGASVDLTVRWQGADLDRLGDAAHARLAQSMVTLLDSLGWDTRVEVSFNHYGDRGRVDVLAMHPRSATLVVVELKSAIGDTQDLLGRLDVKVRLGRVLAASVGWPTPNRIVPALVIGESRASRRIVREPGAVFRRFDLRGRQAVAWLRSPTSGGATGLLWFANLPRAAGGGIRRVKRVRPVTHRA